MAIKTKNRMRTIASIQAPRFGRTRRTIGLYQRKTSQDRSHGRGWFGEPGRHARAARIAAHTRYHNMLERIGIEDVERNVLSGEHGQKWMDADDQRVRNAKERNV